jgi:hypothetical protein
MSRDRDLGEVIPAIEAALEAAFWDWFVDHASAIGAGYAPDLGALRDSLNAVSPKSLDSGESSLRDHDPPLIGG